MILYASKPLLKDLFAGFSFKTADHSSAIADHIKIFAHNQWRGNIRHTSPGSPSDVSIGYIA